MGAASTDDDDTRGGISPAEARAFYDRLGAWQDASGLFENPGVRALLKAGDFATARDVIELGCGTGRVAAELLERHLPADARYRGYDVSATMVALTRERVRPWSPRASVEQTDGAPRLAVADGGCDRVLATYVLDLLPASTIDAVIAEAHRALARPRGRLCVVNLGRGAGPLSRGVARLWGAVVSLSPARFGGCRPLALARRLSPARWRVLHHEAVIVMGVPFEVTVASPR